MSYNEIIGKAHGAMSLVGQHGHFLACNKAWCDLVGYIEDELTKMTWMDITHPDDIKPDQGFVDALLARDLPTYQLVKRYIKKSGVEVKILLTALPVFKMGHFKYFISQAVRIDELRK